jgi:YD repeat-containing protein
MKVPLFACSHRVPLRFSSAAVSLAFALAFCALESGAETPAQTFTDSDDDIYAVSLSGPGSVSVVQAVSGADGKGPIASLTLTDTTSASTLKIAVTQSAVGDGRLQVGSISGSGSLNSVLAQDCEITGTGISMPNGIVRTLLLQRIADGADITIGQQSQGSNTTRITTLDKIGAAKIQIAGKLAGLNAKSVSGAEITSPVIGSVITREGGFNAVLSTPGRLVSLSVTGGDLSGRVSALSIGSIKVNKVKPTGLGGAIVDCTIVAQDNIGPIYAFRDLLTSVIIAGANLGADGVLGGTNLNRDSFSGGSIKSVRIGGNVAQSIIGAGLSPFDGVFRNGDDGVFGGKRSKLGKLIISGKLSSDSLIGGGAFGLIKIEGKRIKLPQLDPRFVSRKLDGVPPPAPDPTKTAPANDRTIATNLSDATKFLYTGSNPVQTGVGANAIEPVRAAVLRGKVLARDGSALPSVSVSILNHGEFGETISRSDGQWDLAVNGGTVLNVQFEKEGLMSAQRQVQVAAQDYTMVADVMLTPADTAVTQVAFGAGSGMQVHEATMQSDQDGARHALLMFQPDTSASLVMPDGTTEPMASLKIRATEFTVGPNGLKAMPAALPPTSAYTYCAEFSADEATTVGAIRVQFDKPVWFYVDNFLKFPTGIDVPIGFFNKEKSQWEAGESGRVIKIIGISDGLAQIDIDGDDDANNAQELAAIGITDSERQQLAVTYPAGTSLWRAAIPHFSTVDANWSGSPGNPAGTPNGGEPKPNKQPDKVDDPPHVYIQNQTLGESLPIAGTPFSLNYRSNRVTGYLSSAKVRIPLSGASLIGAVQRIDLDVAVAGRSFHQEFAPAPNLETTFEWDGKDAYGRSVEGGQPAVVRISNIYKGTYQGTRRFGFQGEFELSGNPTRSETAVTAMYTLMLGNFDFRRQSVGGWTLNVHHAYDPQGRILYQGDGTTRSVQSVNGIISTVAGSGIPFTSGFNNDGIPALDARLGTGIAASFNIGPFALDFGPDGTLYFTATDLHQVFRMTKDGILHVIAGTGTAGSSSDGIPARNARLNRPEGLAVAPDGTVFFSEWTNCRIRSVTPDGIIHTVAGTGTAGYSGDGGPAINAQLRQVIGLTRAPDGTLFLGDANNHRIRRVGTDGIITTVAGTGSPGSFGDGGPARQAQLTFPYSAALDAQGNLYIADTGNLVLRKVTPDGIITTVAGRAGQAVSDATDPAGDGGPASAAILGGPLGGFAATGPTSIHVTTKGELLLGHNGVSRFRLISPDGIIRSVAGSGKFITDPAAPNGEGGAALQAPLGTNINVAFEGLYGPDGSLYIADSPGKIRRVAPPLPGFTDLDFAIPSEDGGQLFRFDKNGRHIETRNAFTGATVLTFGYEANGQLAKITDAFGNLTTVQRSAAGAPVAIIAPFGQRTELTTDATGTLSSVRDPAGGLYSFVSTPDGLITNENDPIGNVTAFTYDSLGMLTRADLPGPSSIGLVRTDLPNGYVVQTTSSLGHTAKFAVEKSSTGDELRTNTNVAGFVTTQRRGVNGADMFVSADGLTQNFIAAPDPRFGFQAPFDR